MGKIRCFLVFFAILFVAVFAGNSAFAAGYDCPTYKKYTSCTANYYMSGGQVAGNSCKPCGANSTSSGGTASTCTCNTGYSSNGTASGSSTSTSGCSRIKVTCSAGTYLPASKTACATCPANSYCPGGTFNYSSSNQGINSCSSDYPNSDAGSSAKTQCYKMATKTGSQLDPAMPTGCAARNLTACTPGTCQYRDYDGGTDGTCTPTNCTKTQTCTSASANYYLDSGSAKACPTTYPYSDGGNINSSYCYKNATKTGSQVNGSVPSGCASVTSWNSCTPGTCEYRDYNGATDGTCTPQNCTKTVAAVTANSGYYDNGTTCPACSSVGDGSYTLSAAGNDGGSSKCYKTCTRACTKKTCPDNATCTHGSETTSGTQYYGGSCNAAASTCSLTFTCNAGYVKNSAGTACEPATYTITYKNGGGTGADQTQSVKYKATFTTKAANTFTRPGYTFKSWGGSYPNPSSSYAYNTTGNTTLTAQWTACANNPTGAGTCNCGSTQYPNGSGCSNCSVSCSGVSGFTLGTYNVCNSQNNSICYRNCTTSDVANSTTVSGTVTKGGTSTCKATMCADGYYVSGSGCKICPANSGVCGESGDPDGFTCADGYHKSADGLSCEPDEYTITLKKNGGSGTVNGVTGTTDATATCKHGLLCTLPDGSGLTRTGYAFTGWGTTPTCTSGIYQETFTANETRYACWSQQTTQCQAGKYYNGTTHVECPAGKFCTGSGSVQIGTAGCGSDCPADGTSPAGSSSNTACYITCGDKSITGGKLTPVDETPNYTGSAYPACKYTATCNTGYVAINQGTATAACQKCTDGENCPGGTDDSEPEECPAGSYCEDGIKKTCPAGGISDAGAGAITDCYKECPASLDIDNGTAASTGDAYYNGSAYPACTYTAVCDENYTAQNSPSANPECVWAAPDACPAGSYCPEDGSGPIECPDGGTSDMGATSAAQCYKVCSDKSIAGGTANADKDKVNWTGSAYPTCTFTADCDAGYIASGNGTAGAACTPCEDGKYCPGGSDESEPEDCPSGSYCEGGKEPQKCPDGGTSAVGSSALTDCYKTGLAYDATYGSGTQRCFYTSGDGASAVYQRDCDTKVINSCRGGYWLESPDDTDCVAVTQNYYSASGDTERHACPANGKTKGETSDDILLCYKDGLPYTEAEHGTGEYLCHYTSGDGADAVYASSCDIPTMTSCDAGYYYDHLVLPDDCMAAGTGYYSPAVDTARYQCPQYPDGTTATTTSASVTECYRVDMMCQIENGVGEQTCNYDDADKNYTADCQTCYVTQCDEGFSQVGNTCIDCPAGSVCTDGEEHTCASLTDGLYPNSDSGTEDVAMCWRECALDENAATMVGRDYYQSTDTCEIKRCVAGFTLDNGVCAECPAGSFCDGETDPENPGDDVKSCADLGNGEWSLSLSGAKDESGCYQKCEADEVINGTAIPVSDKAFYPNECVYEGQSTTGNPCEIVDGVCIETSCNAGYEMKDGVCEKCNRDFAISYKDGGACLVAECVLGYHPNGDQCEPDVQECTAPNAISAERTWDKQKQAFGSCIIKECEYGYHLSSNACVPDVQPCEVENGSGYKEWDTAKNGWGECIATKCNPGYTNDPSETNEHTKQCGECKNRYSVLGKLAASSYVQGCEIASCMYQGELYNLEYNECVPICPMTEYEDETGTMIWDDSRKKCVRTCKDGYTMW